MCWTQLSASVEPSYCIPEKVRCPSNLFALKVKRVITNRNLAWRKCQMVKVAVARRGMEHSQVAWNDNHHVKKKTLLVLIVMLMVLR
mmetsp:Transcript_5923/g.11226  ORF Transcript_5923/g.11226 Transcript_5923/m.11226 type:complete len:87 (+) Transcript_5923:258-518(+)